MVNKFPSIPIRINKTKEPKPFNRIIIVLIICTCVILGVSMFVPSQPRRLSSSETARHKASRVHQQEKELWNSILAEIDLKPDGDLAILLSEIRKRHSELMNCPISSRPLAVNPNRSQWIDAWNHGSEIAIVSPQPIELGGSQVYPAVHFDGTVHLDATLPDWVKISPE